MRRRRLLAAIGGFAAVSPVIALRAHGRRMARIGYLSPLSRDAEAYQTFLGELSRLGYSEGRDLSIAFYVFGENPGALPGMAAEAARARVDLIVADGPEGPLRAARLAAPTIPTVMIAINYDPVERGYVANLAHPGGNITGLYFRSLDLVPKQIELLKMLAPQATRLAVLWTPETEDEFHVAARSAGPVGLDLSSLKLGKPPYDFDAAFRALAAAKPQLALVLSSPAFGFQRSQVAQAALRYRLPAMFRFRSYVEAGGLMCYGVNNPAMHRRAAAYVAKILRGARPADLPVERADQFELVINMKTAAVLGVSVPPLVRARADEVIE